MPMSLGPKPFRGQPSLVPRRRSVARAPRLMAAPAAPPRVRQGACMFRGPAGVLGGPRPCWPPVGPPQAPVTLLGSPEACRRHLDMARELRPELAQPGPKRQPAAAIFCSNYDLDYELYREDAPYRVYEYQRIPPLINRVPVKIRRTHVGVGVKSSYSPYKAPRQIKLRAQELQVIRAELSQIKAQVDNLLESLERMDQQPSQTAGMEDTGENRDPGNEGSVFGTESLQETRSKESTKSQGQRVAAEGASAQNTDDDDDDDEE